MLHLYHSNRLETLSEYLAERLATGGPDPFQPEQIVVQNAGMGRWLSMQLAQHTGIAANLRYLFPAELTWELLRAVLADVPERDPCSPKLLRWRLLAELSNKSRLYQQDLGHYVREGHDESAWQLAKQVAGIFDGYLFFRPDWILRWEKETASDWQERLWQNVAVKQQLDHWARLQQRFIHELQHTPPDKLPARISFFSVPALSPAYIELIAQVAAKVEVCFYVINPSWQYWGDIESRKQKSKRELSTQEYVTVGNPLLASWGTQGRDFIENLRNIDPYPEETEAFTEPRADSLLHVVQADILNLEGEESLPQTPDWRTDHSLAVHACHTPMREVEVLYDQLLAAFEADTTLTAADIVVMSPEIESYAPFIEAVFSAADVSLPFSIADQRFPSVHNISSACLQILELPQSKFEAETVLALLEYAEIRERFDLDEAQIQIARSWVQAVNIRWGVDAEFRRQFAAQTTHEHTWVYGLDRLLLGYAMPGEQLLAGILPYNHLEGSQVQILERLQHFTQTVFMLARWAGQRSPMSQWCERFTQLVTRVFSEDAATWQVLQALDTLQESVRQAEFEQPVSWGIFRDALRTQLEQNNQADGFLGSGITFCTLMPMRSVPFRFVALLGMQDGGFPRQDKRISFDKLAHSKRRRGDRSRRDEDRYLFLESLLSARERLYISYVGQSVLDNTPLMPSVLVSELLDYLEKRFGLNPEQWVVRHPLQAFSPRYFSAEQETLFSYRQELAQIQNHSTRQHDCLPFWQGETLAEPEPAWRFVSLSELMRFYRHPARYFLRQRLDLVLQETETTLETREPFVLEPFVDNAISHQLLPHILLAQEDNTSPDTVRLEAIIRAQGLLPHGKPGELLFSSQLEQVQQLSAQVPRPKELQDFHLHLKAGELELQGDLSQISPQGRQVLLFGYHGARQWLDIWLQHLALNACATLPADWRRETLVYTPETVYCLAAVPDDAEAQLQQLLQGYWQGLQQPLPFFPKSAWKMYQAKTPDISTAQSEWAGTDWHHGESLQAEYTLLYRGVNPLQEQGDAFMYWAEQLFGKLIKQRSELP